MCHFQIRYGDIQKGFEQADMSSLKANTTRRYRSMFSCSLRLVMGYLDEEGRVTIVVAGQWVHEDREQVAHALGLQEEEVRIIYPAIGGAFGGREDMSVQIILGLAAIETT